MAKTDTQLLALYRKRWGKIERFMKEARTCPFCGSLGHNEDCLMEPVEVCGKRIKDLIPGQTYPCRKPAGHKEDCDD